MEKKGPNGRGRKTTPRTQFQTVTVNAPETRQEGAGEYAKGPYINLERLEYTVLSRSQDANFTILDGEAVLLNLDSGFYYTLNPVGTTVWQLIDGVRTLHDIQEAICDRYDVSKEQAIKDLVSLANDFCKEGLVRLMEK